MVSFQSDLSRVPFIFRGADFAGNRMANFLEAGKIPEIGKLAALLRFDRLDRAIVAFQKNTGAVRLFPQRQPAAIPTQPGELLDEIGFAQALECSDSGNFFVCQSHLPRPPTAGRATLTFQENGHAEKLTEYAARTKPRRENSFNLKIEFRIVSSDQGEVKNAAKKPKSEGELIQQAPRNLLKAIKRKIQKTSSLKADIEI